MKREEVSRLLADSAELFARRYLVNGKKVGDSWQCGNVRGDRGDSFSLLLADANGATAGYWQDFSTGEKGGLIDLLAIHHNINLESDEGYREALKICGEIAGKTWTLPEPKKKSVVPVNALPMARPKFIDHLHEYCDVAGSPVFYIARCDATANSKKKFVAYSWFGDERGWHTGLTLKERPPYRLHLMRNDGPVLVVEGELKADVAASILPANWSVLSWAGGAENIDKTKWECLADRTVYFWPDNDSSGAKCKNVFIDLAYQFTHDIYTVKMQDHFMEKFDVKDAVLVLKMDQSQVLDIINNNERYDPVAHHEKFFDCMGYKNGFYYFMKTSSSEIREFSAVSLSEKNLLDLAPLEYWQQLFPGKRQSDSASWTRAADQLIRKCEAAGRYDPIMVKGVGVWSSFVDDNPVVNTGAGVYHNGKKLTFQEAFDAGHGRFVRSRDVGDLYANPPIEDDVTFTISNYFKKEFIWTKTCDPYLMTGWLGIAPIASYLKFRPHLWITADRGSGKSQMMENIIIPLMRDYATFCGVGTTEAAIRGELQRDASPIIYDEAESGNKRGQKEQDANKNVKSLMQLARLSATASGVRIIKGTVNGGSKEYSCQSAFCFLSILPSLDDTADMQRFAVVEPSSKTSKDGRTFSEAAYGMHKRLLNIKNLPVRFLRRQVEMLPFILGAIKGFAKEFSTRKMSGRYGDLYGTILAGLMSMEMPLGSVAEEWSQGGIYTRLVDDIGLLKDTRASHEENETETFFENLMTMTIKGNQGYEERVIDLWKAAAMDSLSRSLLARYGMARHGPYLCIQARVPNQMLRHIRELGHTEKSWTYLARRHEAYVPLTEKVNFDGFMAKDYYAIDVNKVLHIDVGYDTNSRSTHIGQVHERNSW